MGNKKFNNSKGKQKCPVCNGSGLIQKTDKSEISDISPDGQILLQRYNQLRTEIMMRYESRYKLLRINIIVAVASIGVIWKYNAFMWAFIGCLFMLGVGFLMFAELKFVSIIAIYLLEIEKILDEKFNTPCRGWERHLFDLRNEKPIMIRIQSISLLLFIFFFYSLFNYLGCLGFGGYLRYIVFIIVELLIFIVTFIGYKIGKKFYPTKSKKKS